MTSYTASLPTFLSPHCSTLIGRRVLSAGDSSSQPDSRSREQGSGADRLRLPVPAGPGDEPPSVPLPPHRSDRDSVDDVGVGSSRRKAGVFYRGCLLLTFTMMRRETYS